MMKNGKTQAFVSYAFILAMIICSFFTFSELYYPKLNSDIAINILMTPGFSFPGDLYFWGQDRAGSLIPFLSQFFCVIYRFPPVLAVSFVHFGILIAGFFALSTFLKSHISKILLGAAWFFPAWHFHDHIVLLSGIQMSMLAIGLWALRNSGRMKEWWNQLAWHSAACLAFIIAVWVSDPSVVTILILIGFVAWSYRIQKLYPESISKTRDYRTVKLISFIAWTIAGLFFIWYAKHKAVKVDPYNHHVLNSLNGILSSVNILLTTVYKILIFASENTVESIFVWTVILGIPWIIYLSDRKDDKRTFGVRFKWLLFFTVNAIVLFLAAVLSHWVFINGVGRRYFAPVFIFSAIAFLLFIEATRSRRENLRIMIAALIFFFGSLSSVFPFYFPHRLPSSISILSGFKTLGNIGVIGEYWNAYLAAAVDPDHIIATAHDGDNIRNPKLPDKVFKQTKLYLIRDGWMTTFPDTMNQFGNQIVKCGREERIGGYYICKYQRLLYRRVFNPGDLKYQGKIDDDSTAISGHTISISKDFDHSRHFIYGPFLLLKEGHILVRYHIKADQCLSIDPVAILDVSANYGKDILAKKIIRFCDFEASNHYEYFDVLVPLPKDYPGVEFRIQYLGKGELWFDQLEITGM